MKHMGEHIKVYNFYQQLKASLGFTDTRQVGFDILSKKYAAKNKSNIGVAASH